MLSRTAASLYWLGRYIERAEFTARLVEATVRLDAMSARPAGEGAWASALAVVTAQKSFAAEGQPVSQKSVSQFLTLDAKYPGSVRCCIDAARDNAAASSQRRLARAPPSSGVGIGGRPFNPACARYLL